MVAKSVLLLFPFILSFACWADGCQSLKALEEQWVTEELRNLKFDPSRIKQMRNNVILNKRYQELQSEMRGVLEDIMTEFMEYEEMYLELEGDEDFNNLPKAEKEYLLGPNKKKKQFINSIRKSLTNKLLQERKKLKKIQAQRRRERKLLRKIEEQELEEIRLIEERLKEVKLEEERRRERERELQRQKEEEEKKKANSRQTQMCLWKICPAAPWLVDRNR